MLGNNSNDKVKVGIIGGSGYTGAELLRLLVGHPNFYVEYITGHSTKGSEISEAYPALGSQYGGYKFEAFSLERAQECEILFFCLPHGESQDLISICKNISYIVDLSSDFRHDDPQVYIDYYDQQHKDPASLKDFVYGLPELYRDEISKTSRVAAPGCYPTGAILAIKPFVEAGIIQTKKVIVNSLSGISGAGKKPTNLNTFVNASDNAQAYGLSKHRHTPEIQTHSGSTVIFTPHLIPANRGILTTAYGELKKEISQDEVNTILADFYKNEYFIHPQQSPPQLSSVIGSNFVFLHANVDKRTNTLIMMSAIDNLCKGSSGQALQCANIMLGFQENLGLEMVGMCP